MVSYAVSYEKDISDRPLRCRMDPFAIVSAHSESRGKTPYPLLARCSRRHLLHLKKWLSLATFAPRLPSVVYRLLSFQKVPIERVVVSHPQGHACSSERKRVGKNPQPTAVLMDSQSVKTTEESAHPSGYDAHKRTSKGASATSW